MPVPSAAIVGAGIGGLAASHCPCGKPVGPVRIYERAASPRELGFCALCWRRTPWQRSSELGVADAWSGWRGRLGDYGSRFDLPTVSLLRRFFGSQPRRAAGRRAATGPCTARCCRRSGRDALRTLGRAVTRYLVRRGHGVGAGPERRNGDPRPTPVIGADGVGSVVRRYLHPAEPPPRPSGFFALRGVAYGVGAQLGDLAAVGYLGEGVEAATARAGSDAVYWYDPCSPADIVNHPRDPRSVLERVTARFAPPFRAIAGATSDTDLRLEELYVRDPLRHWGSGCATCSATPPIRCCPTLAREPRRP